MEEKAKAIIQYQRRKAIVATAAVILHTTVKEGIDGMSNEAVIEYTRNLQTKFIEENKNIIKPELVQKSISRRQEEVFNRLAKTHYIQQKKGTSYETLNYDHDALFGGNLGVGSNDPCKESESIRQISTYCEETCDLAENAIKNINFIEAIYTISEELELKSSMHPTDLYGLMYAEAEHSSQPSLSLKVINNHQLSEDSGIAFSEGFSEESVTKRKVIPADAIQNVLHSSNTNALVINSLGLTIDYVKREIDENAVETFFNWRGSIVEHACIMCRKCFKIAFQEISLSFILDSLFEIWHSRNINQNMQWEIKIHVIKKLIVTSDISVEILNFASNIMDCITNSTKKNFIPPILLEKFALFLGLYPEVSKSLKEYSAQSLSKERSEESEDVEGLWQFKLCGAEEHGVNRDELENLTQVLSTNIQRLENMFNHMSKNHPIISTLIASAIEELKSLKNQLSS